MEDIDLVADAKRVLEKNWIEGRIELVTFGYTRPSTSGPFLYKTGYQHQWLWDSCFHSYINAKYFDIWRARKEIESLFLPLNKDIPLVGAVNLWRVPQSDGFVGSFVKSFFLGTKQISSQFTQPPFMAMALRAVYEKEKDVEFVKTFLPRLDDHYNYLSVKRDADNDSLPNLIHPLESGTDARPDFFEPFRIRHFRRSLGPARFAFKELLMATQYVLYGRRDVRLIGVDRTVTQSILEFLLARFNFEDPIFSTVYIENLRDLAWLHEQIGDHKAAVLYGEKADISENSLVHKFWDPKDKFFYGLYGRKEKQAKIKTVGGLIPLYLSKLPREKAKYLVEHLMNPKEFWTEYPVPSCSTDEKAFSPGHTATAVLWRGPTWINTNWMIIKGLQKHGFVEEAEALRRKTVDLLKKSGFREYYNPLTGEGYGAIDFGWSTLVVDLLK